MFEELVTVDPRGLTRDEKRSHVRALEAAQVRLDAARMVSVADLDAEGVFADDGATSMAAWLRFQFGTAGGQAREQVRVATRLRSMPVTAAALAAGEVSYGKVRLLAFARTDCTAEVFDRHEQVLVDLARRFGCDDLKRLLDNWKAYADPDGMSADTAAQWTRRNAAIIEGFDGSWSLHGTLDAESGAIVAGMWQSIIDQFRREDAADPVAPDRTVSQRSADALVEMARRAGARDPNTSRPNRPEMIVLVDHDTLTGDIGGLVQLLNGSILPADSAHRLACDSALRRAVVAGESEILDLGRSTPTPNAGQRRALEIRDGGCIWPACDRPPTWCEALSRDNEFSL